MENIKLGDIRIIEKYAFLPTKINFDDGTTGYIWLCNYQIKQEFTKEIRQIPVSYSIDFPYFIEEEIEFWKVIEIKKYFN